MVTLHMGQERSCFMNERKEGGCDEAPQSIKCNNRALVKEEDKLEAQADAFNQVTLQSGTWSNKATMYQENSASSVIMSLTMTGMKGET